MTWEKPEKMTKVKCKKCEHDMAWHRFYGRTCTYEVKPKEEFPYCDCELGARTSGDQLP